NKEVAGEVTWVLGRASARTPLYRGLAEHLLRHKAFGIIHLAQTYRTCWEMGWEVPDSVVRPIPSQQPEPAKPPVQDQTPENVFGDQPRQGQQFQGVGARRPGQQFQPPGMAPAPGTSPGTSETPIPGIPVTPGAVPAGGRPPMPGWYGRTGGNRPVRDWL